MCVCVCPCEDIPCEQVSGSPCVLSITSAWQPQTRHSVTCILLMHNSGLMVSQTAGTAGKQHGPQWSLVLGGELTLHRLHTPGSASTKAAAQERAGAAGRRGGRHC